MKIQKTLETFLELNVQIKHTFSKINFDWDNIQYNAQNPQENFLSTELFHAVDSLMDTMESLDYLNSPVLHDGLIRYENNGIYLDSLKLHNGDIVELLVNKEWVKTVLLLNGSQPVFTPLEDMEYAGLAARTRF